MNILLINHYAGSPSLGMEYRPHLMARNWLALGHRTTIVASSFSHLRQTNPKFTGLSRSEEVDGADFIWLRGPRYSGNGVGRVMNIFAFVFALFWHSGRLLEPRPDLVIASSTYPLDLFPAWWLARRSGARLVYEVHDLWPLSPIELGGMSRWHPFILLMQMAENFACRFSDKVVSLLPKAREHLIAHGLRPDKFSYQPNGVSIEEWAASSAPAPEALCQAVANDRAAGRFTLAYAGAHGVANGLDQLLDAARELRDAPVSITLIGQGPEKARLETKASELGLKNVRFCDPVAKASIPATLALFDGLYIGLQPQPLFRFGISPNKLMDYMMAARPVVSAIRAGNDPVAEANCGISTDPDSPKAIASAILRLAEMGPNERHAMGLRGKAYVVANHDYRKLAQAFLKEVQTC